MEDPTATTYEVHTDMDALTVIATDASGERTDLNATGSPCRTPRELHNFIVELFEQGAYDHATARALIEDLAG